MLNVPLMLADLSSINSLRGSWEKCGAKCAGVVKVRGANPCSDVAVLVTDAVHASHAVADLLRELLPLGSVILKSTTLYSRVFSCQKIKYIFLQQSRY